MDSVENKLPMHLSVVLLFVFFLCFLTLSPLYCFGELNLSLRYVFNLWLSTRLYSDHILLPA